jgi:8-oxo-dGTP pyrophosphatase MutT (NUDIX family)
LLEQAKRPIQPLAPDARLAAVFALLVDREETNLLLIRRAEREADPWSGQIALPGGHTQPEDANPLATAHRETSEEVGIEPDAITCLGNLGRFPTQLPVVRVQVFVGHWDGAAAVRTDPAEVADAFEVPLSTLMETHRRGRFDALGIEELAGRLVYPTDYGTVWGVTARIIRHFLRLVGRIPGVGDEEFV